jgi:hypothetical protein
VGDLRVPTTQEWFINETKWWRDNYSEVQFLPAIIGIPGGFVWDGSALGTTEMAKDVVNLVHSENLTNIKGLSFDWESPREAELNGISDTPNATRHAEAIQIWTEFFNWMDLNAPELILSNINYVEMGADLWDGDFDLHIQERYITYELPRWDEYAPMIYRCPYRFTRPFGDIPTYPAGRVDTTYQFYEQLHSHVDAVKKVHGDTQRVGVYIGITNCTCYGRDINITEFGEYLGTGYDVLVRDTLICKSFRIPTITIFILTTEIENGYSMGGVFESYGDDFLDTFNTSINGPQSTQSFVILVDPAYLDSNLIPERIKPYLKDLLFNLNHPIDFMVIWVLFLCGGTISVIWDLKQEKKAGKQSIN